jgi:hypothetical protein
VFSLPYTHFSLFARCQALFQHFAEHCTWEKASPNTTVVDRRSAESIRAFDSGSTWRGIDVVFATRTNAAGVQCRATRAIATR